MGVPGRHIASPSYERSVAEQQAEQRAIAAAECIARGDLASIAAAIDLIDAVRRGLVRLGDPWTVTDHGLSALRKHGRL